MSIAIETMNAEVSQKVNVSQDGEVMKVNQDGDVAVVSDDTRRGFIHQVEGNELGALVGRSFDYPTRHTASSLPADFDPKQHVLQELLPGTILRVWLKPNADGTNTLMASTHNIPDIRDGGNWGARGFNKAFQSFVVPHLNIGAMSPGSVYIILLQDEENKTGCNCVNGGIHLTTLIPSEGGFVRTDTDIGLPKAKTVTFANRQELIDALAALDAQPVGERTVAGFVALSSDPTDMSTTNIVSDEYEELLAARNNEPHLLKRVVELWSTVTRKDLEQSEVEEARQHLSVLSQLFPQYSAVFDEGFMQKLHIAGKYLTALFAKRHINGEQITLPKNVHFYMISLRKRHVTSLLQNKEDPTRYVFLVTYNSMLTSLQHIPIFEALHLIDWAVKQQQQQQQ